MPIRIKCGSCATTLKVMDHLAGKKIKCPTCQSVVAVPSAATQKATPPAPGTPPPRSGNGTPQSGPAAPTPGVPVKKKPLVAKPAPPGAKLTPPTPKPEPAPEKIEEEALSAFADEPKKAEEEGPPAMIDFRCQWCDEEIHLPVDMAGKQHQCRNEDCKRIIKVPMPKVEGKKDWRKMDQRGPAAAIVSQPEALDNAWGTKDVAKARAQSLLAAGAVELPPKPPLGKEVWILRGVYACLALAGIVLISGGVYKLRNATQQDHVIKDIEALLVGGEKAKITNPVLKAEALRTIALIALQEGASLKEGSAAIRADRQFGGALSLIPENFDKDNPGINEQLFLIELALSQVELGGDEDEEIRKVKLSWEKTREKILATLQRIQAPEVQVMAMREVVARLQEKKQDSMAMGILGNLSNPQDGKRPLVFSLQIALFSLQPNQIETLKKTVKIPDLDEKKKDLDDELARVGYAEGFARQGNFQDALKLAQIPGPATDRLETCLGVATVALGDPKNKDEAVKFINEAVKITKEKGVLSPWLRLHLVKLAARAQVADSVKDLIKGLPEPFMVRAELELFLAKASYKLDDLGPLEEVDKDGTTLALAWFALARQQAQQGASLSTVRRTFTDRLTTPQAHMERIRPLVDLGAYHGRLSYIPRGLD